MNKQVNKQSLIQSMKDLFGRGQVSFSKRKKMRQIIDNKKIKTKHIVSDY